VSLFVAYPHENLRTNFSDKLQGWSLFTMISSLIIIIIIALAVSVSAVLMMMNGGVLPVVSTQQKKTEHCKMYHQHLQDEAGNGEIKTECLSD
jgi:hypothetical protein